MNKTTLLIAGSLIFSTLHAATLVDYPTGVTVGPSSPALAGTSFGGQTNVDFANDGSANDAVSFYSLTTPGSNYTGYTVSGRQALANYGSTTLPGNNGTFNFRDDDNIQNQVLTGTLADQTTSMGTATWMTFDKGSWDNLNAATVSFDNTSSVALTMAFNGGGRSVRALVQANGTYYVSQTSTGGNVTIANAATENWLSYGNATDANGAILFDSGAASTVLGSALTDITSVGFYLEDSSFDGSSLASNHFNTFVNGLEVTAIPEPSTFVLVGVAFASLFAFRCRRKA